MAAIFFATCCSLPVAAQEKADATEDGTEIGVSRTMEGWTIYLSAKLLSFRTTKVNSNAILKPDEKRVDTLETECLPQDRETVLAAFRKAVEWHDRAIETQAPSFRKDLPDLKWNGNPITFIWNANKNTFVRGEGYSEEDGTAQLWSVHNMYDVPLSDIRMFLVLAKYLPAMEKELAQRTADAKALRDTFK